jgi:glycosyltransferase involved in cell wall biosynthesis
MQEGHPLSLLEAMAVELPVVAPRLQSIVEIATEGSPLLYGPPIEGWGTSHDPEDVAGALWAVEQAREVHREKARAARAHVGRTFSREAMIDAHEALYEQVLARDTRGVSLARAIGGLAGRALG